MPDEYDLPPSRARACRWAALFFGLIAVIALATPIALLVITADPLAKWQCGTDRACAFESGALAALDDEVRAQVAASPSAREGFAAHLARVPVRGGLAFLSILSTLPFAALMFGVAMALRSFGTSAGIGAAIRWLRLVAWAALAAALAPPIIGLLHSVLLLPGTPHGPGYAIEVDGGPLLLHCLLAFAVMAVVWALDAGHSAQRDLAEIV